MIWAAGQETRRGHWSAVSRRAVDFRQTDDEGPESAGGGKLNTLIWTERGGEGRKERGDEKGPGGERTRVNLGGGGKEGTRTITDGNT